MCTCDTPLLTLILCIVESLLVDDGIDSNGCLACLSVTDNQLSLATPNWHQTVHSFDTSLHGLTNRDTRDDTRSFHTHTSTFLCHYWSLKGHQKNSKLV